LGVVRHHENGYKKRTSSQEMNMTDKQIITGLIICKFPFNIMCSPDWRLQRNIANPIMVSHIFMISSKQIGTKTDEDGKQQLPRKRR
jgi:hypothetical protein